MVFVLLLSLTLCQVHLFAELTADSLVNEAVRSDWVIRQQEEKMDHAHVRV